MTHYLPTVDRLRHHLPHPARPGWSLCGVIGEHPGTERPIGQMCVWCARAEGLPPSTYNPGDDARRRPIQHGTRNGYAAHLRAGPEPCAPCRAANTAYMAARRARRAA